MKSTLENVLIEFREKHGNMGINVYYFFKLTLGFTYVRHSHGKSCGRVIRFFFED